MIELTRLNGEVFVLNCDMIEMIEERPDTTIRLSNKNYMIVQESMNEVVRRVIRYKREINDIYVKLANMQKEKRFMDSEKET